MDFIKLIGAQIRCNVMQNVMSSQLLDMQMNKTHAVVSGWSTVSSFRVVGTTHGDTNRQ
jgi:hypothetical protein